MALTFNKLLLDFFFCYSTKVIWGRYLSWVNVPSLSVENSSLEEQGAPVALFTPSWEAIDSQWLIGEEVSTSCVKLPLVGGPWTVGESPYHCAYEQHQLDSVVRKYSSQELQTTQAS